MAEGGSTWWGSLLSTAREKSSNVLEFMKRDLDEFTHAVQQETKSYVSSAAGALKETLNIEDTESTANKVKRSFSSFLGTVSQALTTSNENEESAELCVIRNSEPVVMDRIQAQVYSVQTNPKTYLEDPENDIQEYEEWLTKFDLETKQNEMADFLACNLQVEKFYSTLVPNSVSHVVFWHRYFFKMHKVLLAEAKKQEIVRRANEPTESDEIAWDDDDDFVDGDFSNNSDVSEEQANKILADYQQEIHRQKGKLVSDSSKESTPRKKSTENGSANKNNAESFVMVEKTPSMLVVTPSTPTTDDIPSSESSLIKSPENSSDTSLVTKEKGDLVVVGRSTSVGTSPASSNKEGSNDEEWERDFELEATEDESKICTAKNVTKAQVADVPN